ncbi:MAG TPA: hypothetical protein VNX21_05585 [Candidatus Thermoplasmatota archaeon]|nr:hypothetical protein [Candidatus Thermoplasmatota archaeon]
MQTNTGNTGNQGNKWSNAKFVERFEMAVMQFAILSKAQQGEVTRDNLQQVFRGNLQMQGNHFDHCLTQLVQDGHLKEVGGNKFTITDDGREDVQKLHTLVQELPNVIQGGGQSQRQGVTQTQSTGNVGRTGGNVGGGSSGSMTGNVGQQNPGQPKGGPGNSSR